MADEAVTVVAIITAKPEGADEVEQALRTLVAAVHSEDGCLTYSLQRAKDNPAKFITIEKWESQAHLDKHFTSPNMAAVGSAMQNLAEPPVIVMGSTIPIGDPAKGTF